MFFHPEILTLVKSLNPRIYSQPSQTQTLKPQGVCKCVGMHMYECMSIFPPVEQDVGGQSGGPKVKAWLNNYQIQLIHLHTHTLKRHSITTTWVVIFEMSGQCLPLWPPWLVCTRSPIQKYTLEHGLYPSLSQWMERDTQTHTMSQSESVSHWKGYRSGNRGGEKSWAQKRGGVGWIDLACHSQKVKGCHWKPTDMNAHT